MHVWIAARAVWPRSGVPRSGGLELYVTALEVTGADAATDRGGAPACGRTRR